MDECQELRVATKRLPHAVSYWIGAALRSGRYRIGYKSFETDLTVCPVVAGTKMGGVWHDARLLPGHDEWGTPNAPAEEVWNFIVAFDWFADRHGTTEAVRVVSDTLRRLEARGLRDHTELDRASMEGFGAVSAVSHPQARRSVVNG